MSAWLRAAPTSVRFAAMTSSAFLLLMVVGGMVGYREFRADLRDTIDQRLVDVAAVQARAVQGAAGGNGSDGALLADLEPGPDGGLRPSDLEAQILTGDGTVLRATQGLEGAAGLVAGRRLVRVAAGVPVFGDTVVRGEPLRFVGTATMAEGSGRIVVVSTPITELADAERALLAVFGPVAVAGSVFAGLAGAWISRRGLAPLARMAAEADAIGAYDLSQRLPVPPRRDEMRRLGSTLNRMLERLDAAVQRERDFTAEASHELRTPLAILRAEVELARASAVEPAAREGLDSALEEIDRLTAVVEDLLLLARADAAAAVDHRQVVDLGALAWAAIQRFNTVATSRGVTLTASGTATVNGDAKAIERALANLLDNAVRHTPPGGTVSILAEPGTRGAVLVVRDTGPGAEAQTLATLFDRYTRAAARPGSAGLGLSIVAAVAGSHDGGVRARNLPEGGLEITLELVGDGDHGEDARSS